MKKLSIFIGAGASKPFGCPLTNEILKIILDRIKEDNLFDNNSDLCKELYHFLETIMPGIYTTKELPLITDILSLIDFLYLNNNVPSTSINVNDLKYFRALLERAIFEVIDSPNYKFGFEIPATLNHLTKYIEHLSETYSITIISTNYDIYLESELLLNLYKKGNICDLVNYGFGWRQVADGQIINSPPKPLLSIFKLHGSLNWLQCDLCNRIYINPVGSVFHQAFRKEIDDNNTCHCGHAPLQCVILAPSLVNNTGNINLFSLWQNSLESLRNSDEWLIIGYSFPVEDLNIRSMFLRAYNGRENEPQISVIQKDDFARDRYSLFFKHYNYFNEGLEKYLIGKII